MADSVGVKTPVQMPPSRATGMVIGMSAPANALRRAGQPTHGRRSSPVRRATIVTVAINASAINRPGTTPPRNNAPTEASEFNA